MDPKEAARSYSILRDIHGWFSSEAAMLFALLDEVQKEQGITGPLFEIGVHHGKSAALIGLMARSGQEFFAVCDVFERQGSNASGSGSGDRQVFERNMRRLAPGDLDLRVFAKLSSQLDNEELGSGYRFFHIDGGHNATEALGDLRLAAAVTEETGVIVLDDPFRPEWPGVTEALIRFLDSDGRFTPIVVGFNKLVLGHTKHAERYRREISSEGRRTAFGLGFPWHLKNLPFLEQQLQIFYIPTSVRQSDGLLTRVRNLFMP